MGCSLLGVWGPSSIRGVAWRMSSWAGVTLDSPQKGPGAITQSPCGPELPPAGQASLTPERRAWVRDKGAQSPQESHTWFCSHVCKRPLPRLREQGGVSCADDPLSRKSRESISQSNALIFTLHFINRVPETAVPSSGVGRGRPGADVNFPGGCKILPCG